MSEPWVLQIRDLRVRFRTDEGTVHAVDGVSIDVRPGEVLALVGESGCGKTVTALAILGLLPSTATVEGSVLFRGRDLVREPRDVLRRVRGAAIAMVFQDALVALNPVLTIGRQIAEAIRIHQPDVPDAEAMARVHELLDLVGIPSPLQRARQYAHELSGGMRQRAMIAMALANDPDVVIADEPTTALDVTIQAQVLEVLERVRERTRCAILLITHDLGIVAGLAHRVVVMYAGRIAESGDVDSIFYAPRHPYTLGLLASLPRLDESDARLRLHRIEGQPPSLVHVPSGCPFHPRCGFRRVPVPCETQVPSLRAVGAPGQLSACHFAEELADVRPADLRGPGAQP